MSATVAASTARRGRLAGVLRAGPLRDARGRFGAAVTLLVLLVALLGPFFAPHDPTEIVAEPFSPAIPGAPLGTDYLGNDVLSRMLWGGRSVVWMAIAATVLGVVVGASIGLVAGYARNWLDDVIVWVLNVVMAFPQIVFILLFLSVLGRSPGLIVVLVAIGWVPVAGRLTRAVTLQTVNDEFVEAAEVIGSSRRFILFREILPNILTPLLVQSGVLLTWSIGLIAGISFLGFGVQPPHADWGLMINENFHGLTLQPWSVVGPILCIAAFTLGTNTLAEGMSRTAAGIEGRR